ARDNGNAAPDFLLVAKGTSSEDAAGTALGHCTRDQADKANKIATGVAADEDPAGVAYHAVKKYFPILKKKLADMGAKPESKFIVTGHSLGGGVAQRLHLKLYEAGFRSVWTWAFSPPCLDARPV